MKSASDLISTTGLAFLFQAPPKSGKTTLALQFPNPWAADCEGNLDGPLRWIKSTMPEHYKTIKLDHVNTLDNGDLVPDENRWARMVHLTNLAVQDKSIQTIIVDNAGAIGRYLEDLILFKKPEGSEKNKMTISDWQPWRNLMSKFVTDVRAKMLNGRMFIMTSHEETVEDKVSGIIHYRTNIPSKLADNFGGLFSEVWRMEVNENAGQREFTIDAMKSIRQPQLGTSLGVPPRFKGFKWEEFKAKYIDKK